MRLRGKGVLLGSSVAIIVAVALYVSYPSALRAVGGYLVTEEPLEHSSAVVILGGGLPIRAMEAAEIYKAGWAARVVVTRAMRREEYYMLRGLVSDIKEERDYNREILLAAGVPRSAIVMIDEEAENTLEELRLVTQIIGARDEAPLILVTSKIHTRRVRVIWSYLNGNQPKAIVRWARGDPFELDRWWRERRFAFAVLREYLGLVNYWFAFPMG